MRYKPKFNFKLLFKIIFYVGGLLIAIYLVVLASGYKYDRGASRFISTGNIYINSIPKDVKIYINGKLKAERTPLKLGYLFPGKYQVSIEKDGFKKWQKILTIKPGLVSSEPDVVLYYEFPKEETFNNINGVNNLVGNQSKDELIFWTNNAIYRQSVNTKEATEILRYSEKQILTVSGSRDLNKLLIKDRSVAGTDGYQFCPDKECKNIYDLNRGLGLNFDAGKITNDNNYPLLLSTNNNLYLIKSDYTKFYIDSSVLDYTLFNSRIYYFRLEGDEVNIKSSNLEGQDKKTIDTHKLGGCLVGCFAFWPNTKNNRLYLTGEGRKLFILAEGGQKLDDLLTKATNMNFDNQNLLLVQDSSEIELIGKIELTDNNDSMHQVARFSDDIFNPGWFVRTAHILFIKNNTLRTMEIRGSNETQLYSYSTPVNNNYLPISQNEVIVLDDGRLKKLTLCERGGLLNLR